ncbi:MAG: DUF4402 domain-containing protein [Rhodospirillales bacterium]|nr:MAG: DUF4402 domain-containing protein [Rhodospirillales bacterium]
MRQVRRTSTRENRRAMHRACGERIDSAIGRGRWRAWHAAGGAIGLLLLVSVNPALAQVCGTPPCGGGGGKPLTITWAQDLEFGTLAGDGTFSGTATINPVSGAKTVAGGVYDFGGINNPAVFDIRGEKNTTFSITLPGSVILSSGGSTMTLNNFTSSPSGFGVLANNGQATLSVGATLQVGAGQPAGAYTGVFTVTVNYQ